MINNKQDYIISSTSKCPGQVISDIRAKRNMSQRDLAKKVKISSTSLARIEDGSVTSPDSSILRKIAKALHIDYEFLQSLYVRGDSDNDDIRMILKNNNFVDVEMIRKLFSF